MKQLLITALGRGRAGELGKPCPVLRAAQQSLPGGVKEV